MIIDDDAETMTLMVRQLGAIFEARGFSSGEEALKVLLSADPEEVWLPDLILLDIIMNGMDGYEVLGILKEHEELKRIPVVFLTGVTDETSECKGLEMDVVDYLKKPVASKVLFARVQHYIDLYSGTSANGKLDEEKLKALVIPLTDREMDVARLMAEFRSDREISDILHISMPYVKKLVASVKKKLLIDKRGEIRKYLVSS